MPRWSPWCSSPTSWPWPSRSPSCARPRNSLRKRPRPEARPGSCTRLASRLAHPCRTPASQWRPCAAARRLRQTSPAATSRRPGAMGVPRLLARYCLVQARAGHRRRQDAPGRIGDPGERTGFQDGCHETFSTEGLARRRPATVPVQARLVSRPWWREVGLTEPLMWAVTSTLDRVGCTEQG